MRDEKEGSKQASKVKQTNNKAKQHSTPKAVTYTRRVGLIPVLVWLLHVYTCSTSGWSATFLAQARMIRIASMLVSGNAALQANSDRHFTASWNESMVATKCCWNIWSGDRNKY